MKPKNTAAPLGRRRRDCASAIHACARYIKQVQAVQEAVVSMENERDAKKKELDAALEEVDEVTQKTKKILPRLTPMATHTSADLWTRQDPTLRWAGAYAAGLSMG